MTEMKWTLAYVLCVIASVAIFNMFVTYDITVGFSQGAFATLLIYASQLCVLAALFILIRFSFRRAYPSLLNRRKQ